MEVFFSLSAHAVSTSVLRKDRSIVWQAGILPISEVPVHEGTRVLMTPSCTYSPDDFDSCLRLPLMLDLNFTSVG